MWYLLLISSKETVRAKKQIFQCDFKSCCLYDDVTGISLGDFVYAKSVTYTKTHVYIYIYKEKRIVFLFVNFIRDKNLNGDFSW